MSLDVYLYQSTDCQHCGQPSGCASTVLFEANITGNLAAMAARAGIYTACWTPQELLVPEIAKVLHDSEVAKGYHHADTVALRKEVEDTPVRARVLIEPLRAGLARLKADPALFRTYNPDNGWGSYDAFVPWVRRYLEACEQHPTAIVEASR